LVIKEPIKVKAFSKEKDHLGELVLNLATGATRFSRSDDGVITDSTTNLQWLPGPDKDTDYNQAEQWISGAAANVAGGGWQMPTREQLKSLRERNIYRFNISPLFKATDYRYVWAGGDPKPQSYSPSAWHCSFGDGVCNPHPCDQSWHNRVFAVRPRTAPVSAGE